MKNSTPFALALACALGAAAVTAIAQQMPSDGNMPPRHGEHMQERFAEMDANHDGKVSKDEMLAYMAKRDAERAKRRAEFVDAMFKRLDANGDGALSQDELAKAHGQRPHMEMKPKAPAPAQ